VAKILLAILMLIAVAFSAIYFQNSRAPELGVVSGKLMELGSRPNSVASQTADEQKRVLPLAMKESAEATHKAIKAAIKQYGGAEIITETSDYIYAVFTTPLMKYHDDVEFYIDSIAQQVHFRSASRAGYSDRGLNRQRYEALAKSYEEN
jgi:uncharacterized protein (DUF1499 family)